MYKFIKSSQYSYEVGIILSPILKESRGTERLTVMPKITQLGNGKSRNHIQAACLQICNNSATIPLSKILSLPAPGSISILSSKNESLLS